MYLLGVHFYKKIKKTLITRQAQVNSMTQCVICVLPYLPSAC